MVKTSVQFEEERLTVELNWGPFLEGPEKFSDPERHNKNIKP